MATVNGLLTVTHQLCLWCVLCSTPAWGEAQTELQRYSLMHQGLERTYHVHYPGNRLPAAPLPLVFVLHGGGGADAATMAQRTGINLIADRERFAVVYPAGVGGQWNDGRGRTFRRDRDNTDVDDVGFIAALMDRLIAEKVADASRIYVMGPSNGGMMSYRLGIELGHRIAAIASVVANLPENLASTRPKGSVSVLIMNGTLDPMMPWQGGDVRVLGKGYGKVLSTDDTVKYWLMAAGITGSADIYKVASHAAPPACTVIRESYRSKHSAREVVLYRVEGGGHQIPGGHAPDRPRLLGPKCMAINGTEEIWSFFRRHAIVPAVSVL